MIPHPNRKVQSVAEQIGDHMDEILSLFKPGHKITVLVRSPQQPDHSGDLMMTNDTIENAIEALRRRLNPDGTVEGEA